MSGWTPGPWRDGNEAIHVQMDRANPWAGTVFRVSEMSDARALVALTFGATAEEAAANARFLSAAHDLRDALEGFAREARVGRGGTAVTRSKRVNVPASVYYNALAALAKAKGGQS